MKNVILACVLAVSGSAYAQPAERCAGATPATGAPGACPKAPLPATGSTLGPAIGKTEHPEGIDPRQTPYKAGLKQQCDAMAQMLRSDNKLTPGQEEQVRAQYRAFHC
jgi:hypothetical protein